MVARQLQTAPHQPGQEGKEIFLIVGGHLLHGGLADLDHGGLPGVWQEGGAGDSGGCRWVPRVSWAPHLAVRGDHYSGYLGICQGGIHETRSGRPPDVRTQLDTASQPQAVQKQTLLELPSCNWKPIFMTFSPIVDRFT